MWMWNQCNQCVCMCCYTPSLKILVSASNLQACQITLPYRIRGVFRTQSSFYDKVLLRKQLTTRGSNWWPYIVPKTFFEGPPGDVQIMSWERPESTSQKRPLNVRIGSPLNVISRRPRAAHQNVPGRQIETSPGW